MRSRRVFLKSGTMAMVSLGLAPSFIDRAAAATQGRRKLLIAIFQRGAVDGLNVVVPYGEAPYYQLRPSIAIAQPGAAPDASLDLDGFFAFHPRMAPLMPLWQNRSLAIVHACGSPDHTRSHFDAQDYMESATPGVKRTRDGWLNRYLQGTPDERNPLRGIALTRQMPRTLQGVAPVVSLGGIEEFQLRGQPRVQRQIEVAYSRSGDTTLSALGRDAFAAMRTLHEAAAAVPASIVSYPRSRFGRALQEIARLAKADIGLEVAFAETGGWDHHANEGGASGQLAQRLDDFALGLAALVTDLGERMRDTMIVTMSEFGRTVAENGTRGTDHGHGNAVLLIGAPVRGGHVYGRWPGLAPNQQNEGRDLAITTDFRQVFSDVLTGHMGAAASDLTRIFPGFTPGAALGMLG